MWHQSLGSEALPEGAIKAAVLRSALSGRPDRSAALDSSVCTSSIAADSEPSPLMTPCSGTPVVLPPDTKPTSMSGSRT